MNAVMNSVIGVEYSVRSVNGIEIVTVWNTRTMPLYQKNNWTRSGVPRKNQM